MAVFQVDFSSSGSGKVQKDIDSLTNSLKDAASQAGLASKKIGDMGSKSEDAAKSSNNLSGALSGFAGNVAANAIASITQQLTAFVQQSFEAGQKFETFRSIIKNTTGSFVVADQELARLAEFSKTTPFQIEELVEAFIKLSNRGIKPTNDVLRQFGDLALSQGKSLDQLIEAVLDASTGEFERLKEFGINASKSGDQVELSFKGINKQVALTESAIQGALAEFAKLPGVAGSIGSVAATTEGQISNLEDSFSQLQVQLFNKLQPTFNEVIGELSSLLATATDESSEVNNAIDSVIATLDAVFTILKGVASFLTPFAEVPIGILNDALRGLSLVNEALVVLQDNAQNLSGPLGAVADKVQGVLSFLGNTVDRTGAAFASATGATEKYASQLEIFKNANRSLGEEVKSLSTKIKNASQEDLDAYLRVADGLSLSIDEQISALRSKLRVVQDPELKAGYQAEIDSLLSVKSTLGEAAAAATDKRDASIKAARDAADEEKKRAQQLKADLEEKAAEEKRIADELAKEKKRIEEELAKEKERIEQERIATQKALRQAELDKDLQNIEIAKKAAELAAQARIDAENQVLEALDDQSTAINNQLALLEIQQSNESAVSAAQIARYDRQIEDLGKVAGYLDIVNDKESSLVEKQLAKNELQRIGISQDSDLNNLIFNREQRLDIVNTLLQTGIDKRNKEISLQDLIIYNEEKKRQAEKSALLARQEGEQKVLGLQQEQQRIELQRQVSQAKIAEIEAQSLITQTELKIKGEERLLTFKKMELAAAQAEGASKSELIALQGQVDAQNTALQLAQSELPLAHEQANLAGQQLADARDAVIAGENLFKAQSDQLGISQDLERKALETANHGERLATALGDSTGGAAGTADGLERAADAAERTAAAVEATVSATESLSRLQGKSIPGPGSLGRVEEFNKRAEEAGEALENLPGLKMVYAGQGNQYYIGDRQVSESDYNKEIQAREDLRKLANTRLGGEISTPLSPVNDSYAALKDTVESLERFQQNSRNLARSIGLPTMVTVPKGSDRELEERLAKSPAGVALAKWEEELRNFFTNYKDQSLALTDELLAEETAKVEAARDAARKKAMTDNSQQTQDEVEEFTRKWDILNQINTDRLEEQRQQEAAAARVRAEEEAAIRREVIQIEGDKLTADQIKAEKDLLEFRIANEQSLKGWELDRVNARLEALKQVEATLTRINELERLQGAVVTAGGIVSIPGRAGGGRVGAGQAYIVGENGAEIFVPRTNGYIVSNEDIKDIISQSPRGGGFSSSSLGDQSTDRVAVGRVASVLSQVVDRTPAKPNAPRGGGFFSSDTIVPRVSSTPSITLGRVESLLTQLVNRPVPVVNAPATFINQPNPIQTQVELLQGQIRAARSAV